MAKMMTTARRIGAGNGSSIMVRFDYQQSRQPQTTVLPTYCIIAALAYLVLVRAQKGKIDECDVFSF